VLAAVAAEQEAAAEAETPQLAAGED